MDIKSLNKLAKACRKLGVSHLKTDEVELNLSADIVPARKRTRKQSAPANESLFNEPDAYAQQKRALTDTDLLFWSTNSADDQ